ncbi:MAG: ATP-binding protein [Defluviitaleaceae bacterium]|nr:ATP-binding protein [Defluviitaleaceae bacterium]MCL2262418.1 ATP-binding protein [Defluviitaleaceae bacterium]
MISFVRKYILKNSGEYAPQIFLVLCVYLAASAVYTEIVDARDILHMRLVLTAIVLASFIIVERSLMDMEAKAFLSPLVIGLGITVWSIFFGDFLIFTYTIGCAVISLTYLNPKALRKYIITVGAIQVAYVIVLGNNLLGSIFSWQQNVVGLAASIGINYVIWIFCNNYSKMLGDLRDATNDASQAAETKGAFLSNMSHEIRTPLNAIIGMTAIGKVAKTTDEMVYAFDKIEGASVQLLNIVNDVLDMAEIEAGGRLEISCAEFNLESTLSGVANIMMSSMQAKKHKFDICIDKNIPPMLVGDAQRTAQIVMNILGNAVKFTGDNGKIQLTAVLLSGVHENSCTVEIRVADSGIGISDAQKASLFDLFSQVESTSSRRFGGTGLGLSISKNIIEEMGGTIRVESQLGKGATFIVTLTMARGVGKKHEYMSPQKNVDYSKYHILLAEDIEINCEIVMALLEPTGIQITCAENGAKAVELFMENPDKFDLIFMDIQMPEMDGYSATRTIRAADGIEKARTIPIIALTANVLSEDVQKSLDAGMNRHLGKPINVDEVLTAIEDFLPNAS